jgi:4-amino-4-deoxy-L-arabinose transferase-like glycosyltransferase
LSRSSRFAAVEHAIGERAAWTLVLTATVTLVVQLIVLSQRDVLILEWRPTDLAAIALNYYRNGFDFLHPQILWGGDGPGYVEMEFPLIPFAIAVLYRVAGVHDWLALVIPIACGIALPIVVNRLTDRLAGATAGFAAGLFTAVSPAWIAMSTGLWPDAPPLLCASLGLLVLVRWVDRATPARFALSAFFIALAILLKLPSLYVGLPVWFLFWTKYGGRWWRAPQTWTFAALVLIPPVLWYVHAYRLFVQTGNTFGIIASGYMKFASAAILTDPRFYAKTFARIAAFHLTPLGLLFAAAGMLQPPVRRVQYVFHVWLAAVLLYLLIAAEGVSLGHYQYALPVVPAAAAFAGIGFAAVLRRFLESSRIAMSMPPVAGIMAILFVGNAAAANYGLQARGMDFRMLSAEKMRTGLALAAVSPPDALIVVVDADMDDRTPETSMTPPEVFYFSGRRGWYRAMSWLTPEMIEQLRARGARYIAVSANNVRRFRAHYSDLYRKCSERYRTLMDNDDGIIYELDAERR